MKLCNSSYSTNLIISSEHIVFMQLYDFNKYAKFYLEINNSCWGSLCNYSVQSILMKVENKRKSIICMKTEKLQDLDVMTFMVVKICFATGNKVDTRYHSSTGSWM